MPGQKAGNQPRRMMFWQSPTRRLLSRRYQFMSLNPKTNARCKSRKPARKADVSLGRMPETAALALSAHAHTGTPMLTTQVAPRPHLRSFRWASSHQWTWRSGTRLRRSSGMKNRIPLPQCQFYFCLYRSDPRHIMHYLILEHPTRSSVLKWSSNPPCGCCH